MMLAKDHAAAENDRRWAAVRARDTSTDGSFFYSVRTTGVYCRPSCGSRPARPENVAFHASAADARRAGPPAVQALRAGRSPPRPSVEPRSRLR